MVEGFCGECEKDFKERDKRFCFKCGTKIKESGE